MAKRRMFSLDVVDTDSFLDLPASSQSLYFHLGTTLQTAGCKGKESLSRIGRLASRLRRRTIFRSSQAQAVRRGYGHMEVRA